MIKRFILKLIEFIEDIQYKDINTTNKVIESLNIKSSNIQIRTDTGWSPLSHIHKTNRFDTYTIETDRGSIMCADNHILYKTNMDEVWAKDLKYGDKLIVNNQEASVTNIINHGVKLSMYDVTVDDANHRFYANGFLSHNSVMTAILILQYISFNTEKNVLIVANKLETVHEIIDKIKQIYRRMPFFMQSGIVSHNMKTILFDTDCKIHGVATTKTPAIGFTVDFLFIDEAAHIQENIIRSFYKSVIPTMSAVKNSRTVITSTANGYNFFWELHDNAMKKENTYKPLTTYWYDVPGRDEEWKKNEIKKLNGSIDMFEQEYECKFSSGESLLLDSKTMKTIGDNLNNYTHYILPDFEDLNIDYSGLTWNTELYDKIMENIGTDYYILSVDLSHGVGKDYSVITIFKIESMTPEEIQKVKKPKSEYDFLKLKQVGIFQSNEQPINEIAKITMTLVRTLGIDNTLISYETNMGGDYFYKCLEEDDDFYSQMIVRTIHNRASKLAKPGIKINSENKIEFCNELKYLVREGFIILNNLETLNEFKRFGLNTNGSYSADSGHDDIAMTIVNLVPVIKSNTYKDFASIMFESYDKQTLDLIYEMLGKAEEYEDMIDYDNVDRNIEHYDTIKDLSTAFNYNIQSKLFKI